MARNTEQTRRRILDGAYELFYRRGFVRVNLDDIAAKAGVTKRTLYYHFASKDELLAAALDFHHELAFARIRRWSARVDSGIEAILKRLFADLAAWATRPRWEGAGYTRLVWELADLPGHPARAIARRHKRAVESWLAGEFAAQRVPNPKELARQVMLLLEGCLSLIMIHGDRGYAEDAARAAKRLLAA